MFKSLRIAGVILATVVMINIMIASHLMMSKAEAMNEMVRCEDSGGIACHIERDGLDYGVYSW